MFLFPIYLLRVLFFCFFMGLQHLYFVFRFLYFIQFIRFCFCFLVCHISQNSTILFLFSRFSYLSKFYDFVFVFSFFIFLKLIRFYFSFIVSYFSQFYDFVFVFSFFIFLKLIRFCSSIILLFIGIDTVFLILLIRTSHISILFHLIVFIFFKFFIRFNGTFLFE